MTEVREEYWTMRDGRKIVVGDMDVDHLRNTLRMLIRKARKARASSVARAALAEALDSMTQFEWEDMRDAQAYQDLANPHVFFPLIDGGVYGSPELQKRHGGSI